MKQNYDNNEANRQNKARKPFCKVQAVAVCSAYQHSSLPKPPSSPFLSGTLLVSDFTLFSLANCALFSSFICFLPFPCVPGCSEGHIAGQGWHSIPGSPTAVPRLPHLQENFQRLISRWSLLSPRSV